jgi:hypothetical protein
MVTGRVRGAVLRSASNSFAGGRAPRGAIFFEVRSAATHPAATGHAAEVPLSGKPAPKASDPKKWVYDVTSGFSGYMLGMDGP